MLRWFALFLTVLFALLLDAGATRAQRDAEREEESNRPAPIGRTRTFEGELRHADLLAAAPGKRLWSTHKVNLQAGQTYLVELRTFDFVPHLGIEDDANTVLARSPEAGKDEFGTRLIVTPPRDGSYQIVVVGDMHGSGDYVVQVVPLNSDGPPRAVEGRLTEQSPRVKGHRCETHRIPVVAGRWYALELTKANFSPLLGLKGAAGRPLGGDISRGQLPPRLAARADAAGTWVAEATSTTADGAGSYRLSWRAYRAVGPQALTAREVLRRRARALTLSYNEHLAKGRAAEAITAARADLTLRRDLFPPGHYPDGHPELATGLNNLGVALLAAGESVRALPVLDEALAMRKKLYPARHFPNGHHALFVSLHNLGGAHWRLGAYDRAVPYLEQAVALHRRLFPPDRHPDRRHEYAAALSALGIAQRDHGEQTQAMKNLTEALLVFEQLHPGQDDLGLARTLNSLGRALQGAGEFGTSRARLERCLAMYERLYPAARFPNGHPDLVYCLRNLGITLHDLGEYGSALRHYERAVAHATKLFTAHDYPRGHPLLAHSLNSVGEMLQDIGEHEKARPYFERALAILEKLYPTTEFPDGHPDLAQGLTLLGNALHVRGESALALPYCERALAMREKLYPVARYPNGHAELASSLHIMTTVLMELRKTATAARYQERALAMRERLYPAERHPRGHLEIVISLHNQGWLLNRLGEHEKALTYYRRALAMTKALYPAKDFPHGHPVRASTLNNLGILLTDLERYREARPVLEQALAMFHDLFAHFAGGAPEAQALAWLNDLPLTRDAYLNATADMPDAATAYEHIWHSRAILTRVLERRHHATRIALRGDMQTRRSWRELTELRAELARLALAPLAGDGADREKALARLTERKEALERALAEQLPELTRASTRDHSNPNDLAARLPRGSALIDLLRHKWRDKTGKVHADYTAFIVLPGLPIKRVALGNAGPIEAAARDWRRLIAAGRDTPADATKVSTLVWAPLAKALPAGTLTIYLAPDGELARLPWCALPGAKPGTVLLETLTLAVVPHGPFLLETLARPPIERPGRGTVLLVGGVDYGPGSTWRPLPGAAAEVRQVRAFAGKRSVLSLERNEANWTAVRKALPKAHWAHLATHGLYDDAALAAERRRLSRPTGRSRGFTRFGAAGRSPLAFTGLALAGANDPKGDGLVTGEALVGLPLDHLYLCVLSACESGLGDLGPVAGEPAQGLPRALHLAGCRNVISSLWNVNDKATAALMARFYHELWVAKRPPLEALRQAQLTILRHPGRIDDLADRGRPDFAKTVRLPADSATSGRRAATRLWAAFVLSGTGR